MHDSAPNIAECFHTKLPQSLRTLNNITGTMEGGGVYSWGLDWRKTVEFTTQLLLSCVANHTLLKTTP